MPFAPGMGIWWEMVGRGPPVMVGLPLVASAAQVFGLAGAAMRAAWEAALADRYTLLLVDYPGVGRSADHDPGTMTAERVVGDLLEVADAAGSARFAFVGYSWGGAVGLQLACRCDRLTALAVGGWAPLGGLASVMHEVSAARVGNVPESARVMLRDDDQYRQWPAFYGSLLDWPEAPAVGALSLPRLLFYGEHGDLMEDGRAVSIATANRATRAMLERQGWMVRELPGLAHGDIGRSDVVLPVIREFLAKALP